MWRCSFGERSNCTIASRSSEALLKSFKSVSEYLNVCRKGMPLEVGTANGRRWRCSRAAGRGTRHTDSVGHSGEFSQSGSRKPDYIGAGRPRLNPGPADTLHRGSLRTCSYTLSLCAAYCSDAELQMLPIANPAQSSATEILLQDFCSSRSVCSKQFGQL